MWHQRMVVVRSGYNPAGQQCHSSHHEVHCFLVYAFLPRKISNISKSRENRIMNPCVYVIRLDNYQLTANMSLRACWVMSDSATPWIIAHQTPQAMEFSRPECWSGLPFPPPWDLPGTGSELKSPWVSRQILYHWASWEALLYTQLF